MVAAWFGLWEAVGFPLKERDSRARASIPHSAHWTPPMTIWLRCRRFIAFCM